ncbi:imidazole glycerol phosphate synthase subunit HisH [Arhodomonas aquaeolei]|uniref:imidazole glycerol phosphate synthase subunit HisH n=1 Tax=Arhodomonas aquaeolei TaxID=2369 RepID=UPI002167F75F|nr:imidazole glycerol phosphate synthase subunit HisH [Arhodomonas aquaeolei]MCS4505088.1 imidazole glycerol phosphate synthase subunit HisH [Arhodomonas aquaeolei]
MASTVVVDYGMGNLRSMAKALEHAGAGDVRVTDDAETIAAADRVVFPGQGAARDCMSALHAHELIDVLGESMVRKPFLGACMGMQVLLAWSEENGGIDLLGRFPGRIRHFRHHFTAADTGLKVPHMGWNRVRQTTSHPLWAGIDDGEWFYFVHSYYAEPDEDALVLGRTDYGGPFASVLGRGNIFATQFHPEKSHDAGVRLLANFVRWDGAA